MKFKIRSGFVFSRVDRAQANGPDGRPRMQERAMSAYEGDVVDLTVDQAQEHLHMLEPADKDAQRWIAGKAMTPPRAAAAVTEPAAVAQA